MDLDFESESFAGMVLAASYSEMSEKRRELVNKIDGNAFHLMEMDFAVGQMTCKEFFGRSRLVTKKNLN